MANTAAIAHSSDPDRDERATTSSGGVREQSARPRNVLVFIRDQVKPEDLWLPRDWARENLPNQQWLKDNGLSFSNAFTNSAMCTSARATFYTSKFPAQHEVGLVLSDITNPILDSQIQLNPDLPNLATVLKGEGYDVSFFGKAHLSKTFTLDKGTPDTSDDELVYQDLSAYGFDDWQGPDAGQDLKLENFGGGTADHDSDYTQQAVDWLTNRAASDQDKPFCIVVSLINPHDVLSYLNTYLDGGYTEDWLQGTIKELPPTVSEDLRSNLKPAVQSQWKVLHTVLSHSFLIKRRLTISISRAILSRSSTRRWARYSTCSVQMRMSTSCATP